jgi:hypothetical protein
MRGYLPALREFFPPKILIVLSESEKSKSSKKNYNRFGKASVTDRPEFISLGLIKRLIIFFFFA